MTTDTHDAAPPRHTDDRRQTSTRPGPAPSPRLRGNGQWALGFREPLNANERTKADDDGLNVRGRIEIIYSRNGFASIGCAPCTRPVRPGENARAGRCRQERVRDPRMTSSTCMSPMTEHTGYPLLLDVRGRRVLVVGGGPIAARRMQGLLDAGAEVHVVTPFVCEDVWDAATAGKVTVQLREFAAEDLSDVWLVHTATGDRPTDRLAPLALLDALDPAVEVIDAGKAPHAHTLIQDEINALIVERARSGKRVVRLKGGAPFVLGRGSEEVAACRDAGVAVTVVPGVTSALAAPAAAGIPVTARGITSRFSVVSGHDGPLDFASLAALEGTLLFMMGVARLPEIARELMTNGRSATEPVAVIENGTTPEQRVTQATLATIAERAAARGVRSPAVIVVGDVAALADL